MNKIYISEQEFLKEFGYTNPFTYQLFQHFIHFNVEEEDIEDWVHNPFDFETPHFSITYSEDLFSEVHYEDAIQFKRLNATYGRDAKIEQIISTH